MYNEKMIEEVRDYLCGDTELAIECLVEIGECDWNDVYTLSSLYHDYFGDLADFVNAILDAGIDEVSMWDEYYVKDGEVKYTDEMQYDIEEVLWDDDIVAQIIDEIIEENINVPDELYNMCRVADWERASECIGDGYMSIAKDYSQKVHEGTPGATPWFIVNCLEFATIYRVYDCLMDNKGFAKSDKDFELLVGMAWDNALCSIADFAKEFAVGGVTIEKATEVWIKKNVLEG